MKNLSRVFKTFVLLLPFILLFSYHPIIPLGGNESMNFELSLPLLWLVFFDLVGLVLLICRDGFLKSAEGIIKKWKWLLFPLFLTISCLWSLNILRGILTVGILWLIYFAGYLFYSFRDLWDLGFWKSFRKIVIWASGLVFGFLVLQCVLDLAGVSREYTLLCQGCTYRMFGFPHPNGFAIEPQFMGNILLLPLLLFSKELLTVACPAGTLPAALAKSSCPAKHVTAKSSLLVLVPTISLFLIFSRGAIYAGVVGLLFMSTMMIVREKKKRKEVGKKIGKVWGLVVLAFLFTLNLQGIMAEVSPTNDTYFSGVSKVLNHLSLGVIDVRGEDKVIDGSESESEESIKEEAVFDGYVAESTDTRVKLTNVALTVWGQDFRTIVFGVGLGGAGKALYNSGLFSSSKEIVQNQYISLLLETGLVGISLLIMALVMVVRVMIKNKQAPFLLALMITYGVSLLFFSGLPNVLHTYLLLSLFSLPKSTRVLE